MQEYIAFLSANLDKLSDKDQAFAFSLLSSAKSSRGATFKQEAWIKTLADRIKNPPQSVTVNVDKIKAVLGKVKAKFPKLCLTVDGRSYSFSINGDKSSTPGAMSVTDGGGYNRNTYYGRIMPDGTWDGRDNSVLPVIKLIADDPLAAIKAHGHTTGRCCFCNDLLTNETSKRVGYGPVCAKKWKLAYK